MSVNSGLKMRAKPIVHYNPDKSQYIKVGNSAFIFPIDHQSEFVSNMCIATTSKVIKMEEGGRFETENTLYVPATK
jgi:hypothetical protein